MLYFAKAHSPIMKILVSFAKQQKSFPILKAILHFLRLLLAFLRAWKFLLSEKLILVDLHFAENQKI